MKNQESPRQQMVEPKKERKAKLLKSEVAVYISIVIKCD